MKLLRMDLIVPFWCSFAEYGTLNLQQTYLFPPPPTIFGMILNAMGKPAIHTSDEAYQETISTAYLSAYDNLRFSIVVRDPGERIDDYLNILKGSRILEGYRDNLAKDLDEFVKAASIPLEGKIVKEIASQFTQDAVIKEKPEGITKIISDCGIAGNDYSCLERYLTKKYQKLSLQENYELQKVFLRTQIRRQRIIQPEYTVYISSSDEDGEYSLSAISNALRYPARQLYLGESDDLVDVRIEGSGIVNVEAESSNSSEISSVLPGPRIYQNCLITKIPVRLRNDTRAGRMTNCSIPQGDLREEVPCIDVCGESIVFL